MKTINRTIIYFAGIVIAMIILFNVVTYVKARNNFEDRNALCIQITDELNKNINESSTCVDYYCYYARYSPPEGMEITETLCICDCRTDNGTIVSSQILNIKT
jgi:hypothetical protein